ncbi:hypothetical protein QBC38DRAFT_454404 [Podospora fimiseda]|uniref:Uncharacterized protein n=1 Tax=Podospora fimiseda TaxID=252190 RepID=A0AAN7BRV1_9PEZI|nr:hypothetical protein QBC38DRAFT_454404 [Podospora fimiseda]
MYNGAFLIPTRGSSRLANTDASVNQRLRDNSVDLSAVGIPFRTEMNETCSVIRYRSSGLLQANPPSHRLYPGASHSTFGPVRPSGSSQDTSSYTHSSNSLSPTWLSEKYEDEDADDIMKSGTTVKPGALPWPLAYGDQATMMAYAAIRQGPAALHLFDTGMDCFNRRNHGSIYTYGKRTISPESDQASFPTLGISSKMFASWAEGCSQKATFADLVEEETKKLKNKRVNEEETVIYPRAACLTQPRRKFSPPERQAELARRPEITPPDQTDTGDDYLWTPLSASHTTTALTHRLDAYIRPLPSLPKSNTAPSLRRTKVRWGDVSIKEMTPERSFASIDDNSNPSYVHDDYWDSDSEPDCTPSCKGKAKIQGWKRKIKRRLGLEKTKRWY